MEEIFIDDAAVIFPTELAAGTEPELAETIEQVTDLASDFVDKFMNMDFINEIVLEYAKIFAIGFAFTTLLILITYGVFKAFGLVRID